MISISEASILRIPKIPPALRFFRMANLSSALANLSYMPSGDVMLGLERMCWRNSVFVRWPTNFNVNI